MFDPLGSRSRAASYNEGWCREYLLRNQRRSRPQHLRIQQRIAINGDSGRLTALRGVARRGVLLASDVKLLTNAGTARDRLWRLLTRNYSVHVRSHSPMPYAPKLNTPVSPWLISISAVYVPRIDHGVPSFRSPSFLHGTVKPRGRPGSSRFGLLRCMCCGYAVS